MDTIRVSATDVDAFRRWRDDDEDREDLIRLIQQLRRLMPSTEAMEAGSALHAAIENAEPGDHRFFKHGEFGFSFETDCEIDLPPIREMKATRCYLIDGTEVTLVGKVDAIHGKRIDDHKFTAQFDAERYLDSFQWRAYLEVFEADTFRWNVFVAKESAPKNYIIRDFHRLQMDRYPGIGEDVERELGEFVRFARDHLPERFVPKAERILELGAL